MRDYEIREVHNSRDFRTFLEWQDGQPWVAVDTETSSAERLYRPDFRVRLIQIGDARTGWVFRWDTWGRPAAVALQEFPGLYIIHNSAYDVAVLNRQGIDLNWARVIDTFLAMRIAEPTEPSALKESCNRHVAPDADLSQKDLKDAMTRNGWSWDTVPIDLPTFVTYAGMDPILTARLYLTPVVQAALRSPAWRLEMDTAALCAQMAHAGMRIDIDLTTQRRDRLLAQADKRRMVLESAHHINLGSPAQVSRWFFDNPDSRDLLTKKTAAGAASVDKEILGKIAGNVPGTAAADVAAGVLEVRGWEKMAKSYFQVFLNNADSDGRVHPSILTSEARSGRMAIRQPALQTLPKDESAGVRSVVLPRSPGEVLISSDWDQIEMRLAAVFSKDLGLQQTFKDADASGSDFFTGMGANIYHDPRFQKTDLRRRIVKNAMYASLYGAGAAKIASTAQIPVAEARRVLNDIFTTYPGLKRLMQNAEAQARRDGQITTLGGRTLTVPPDFAYKALNYLIQGSAGFLLKRTLVDLAQAGLDEFLMVPVHDEVVLSVPHDAVKPVREALAQIMPIRDLPLEIGAEPSAPMQRWGVYADAASALSAAS